MISPLQQLIVEKEQLIDKRAMNQAAYIPVTSALPLPINYPLTRSRYSPERVSTRTLSPSFRKSGTCTTAPVSSVAGLVPPVAVSPRIPGSVDEIARIAKFGGSIATIDPSSAKRISQLSDSFKNLAPVPTSRSATLICSYVSLSINTKSEPSRYRNCIGFFSIRTISTSSPERKRTSLRLPVFIFRILACTNARRLPGVRCVYSSIWYSSPSIRRTPPTRKSFVVAMKSLKTANFDDVSPKIRMKRWKTGHSAGRSLSDIQPRANRGKFTENSEGQNGMKK